MIPSIKCEIHKNENIEFIDISKKPRRENIAYCLECLSDGGKLNEICQIKNVPEQINSYCDQMTKAIGLEYDQWISKINKAKQIIITLKEQIISNINEIINKCENYLNQLAKDLKLEQEIYQNINNINNDVSKLQLIGNMLSGNHQRESKLSEQSNLIFVDEMAIKLNELLINEWNATTEIKDIFNDQIKLRNKFRQENWCYAFACNQEHQMIVGGRGNDIVIWKQNLLNLTEAFLLQGHKDVILALVLYKSGDIIVSGGGNNDKSIKLWRKQDNQWDCKQTINYRITDLQLTNNQQHLVTALIFPQQNLVGTMDIAIKVWIMEKKQLECIQTLKDHTSLIYWISISEDSKFMASSSSEKYLNIYKVEQNRIQPHETQTNLWKKQDEIQTIGKIHRVYFTKDNELLVQQESPPFVIVYQKSQSQNFQAIQEIILNQSDNNDIFFPIFQIDNRIYLKNDKFIYILRRLRTGKYLIQSILTGLYYSGCRDTSGEAIILWNPENRMIEIYK